MKRGDLVRNNAEEWQCDSIIWPTPRRTYYSTPGEIIGYMRKSDLAVVLSEALSKQRIVTGQTRDIAFLKILLCNGLVGWVEKTHLCTV